MNNSSELFVSYASDDNYAVYMGVSMLSLFESNKDINNIVVYVLDCGIGECNRRKLMEVAEKYQRKIVFTAVDDLVAGLKLNMGTRKISVVSYARLFLSSIVPEYVDKVIYIDCDTIVCNSILPMWNTNLENALVAGVQDTVDSYFNRIIKLDREVRYVNAGILLINLCLWRKENIQNSFLKYIDEMNGTVPHHDQGVINHVCAERRVILPLRFNVTSNIFTFSEKTIRRMHRIDGKYYTQQEIDEVRKRPTILHFTTGLLGRPWEENCRHPYKDYYEKVLESSPWHGTAKLNDTMKLSVKASRFVCNHISSALFGEIYRMTSWILHR